MKRFLECLIPVTVCNMKCEYCYIIQEERRTMQMPKFEYTADHIAKGLSVERLGGISYISICGAGETLVPKETLDIVHAILKQGHYVNITTNGTLINRFKEIVTWQPDLLSRLHFAFSFHYLELIRLHLLDTFFDNIQRVKGAGCSFVVQINLYDGYIPYWDKIKEICEEKLGACPQVAVTRNEQSSEICFLTELKPEEYIKIGRKFNSPLWEFTLENFMVPRREFCYAGDWTATLNLCNGEMTSCYGHGIKQNIFKNIKRPIIFRAVGKNCCSPYCINSSHFLSLGCIPTLKTPTYEVLRNRKEGAWYSEEMRQFLSTKLVDENMEYSFWRKNIANTKAMPEYCLRKVKNVIKYILRK